MKYEFSVCMQQRHLKAIVGSAAQALPSGHGGGLVGKRCLLDTGAALWASTAFRTRTRALRLDWR